MKMVDSYYNFRSEYPESAVALRSLNRMFRDAKAYVDQNQQAAVDIEKNRIDAESLKAEIRVQKEKLRTITDQLERDAAKRKLRADEALLKEQQRRIKAEAKQLKKNDTRLRKREKKGAVAEEAAEEEKIWVETEK